MRSKSKSKSARRAKSTSPMRAMSKSPLTIVREAYALGRQSLEPYSCRKSKKVFTQPQLFAILVLRQFLTMDYRGVVAMLADWSDAREALDLKRVPNYSTLCYAEQRLQKKGSTLNLNAPSSHASKSAA